MFEKRLVRHGNNDPLVLDIGRQQAVLDEGIDDDRCRRGEFVTVHLASNRCFPLIDGHQLQQRRDDLFPRQPGPGARLRQGGLGLTHQSATQTTDFVIPLAGQDATPGHPVGQLFQRVREQWEARTAAGTGEQVRDEAVVEPQSGDPRRAFDRGPESVGVQRAQHLGVAPQV